MFINKQFRNFALSKSVFRYCIFEVARVNSINISFSIMKILSKKCVANLKLNLLCSLMNAKDDSLKYQPMVYKVTTIFAEKLFVIQFCNVCNYAFHSNFFSEKYFSLKLLLDIVVIFSN